MNIERRIENYWDARSEAFGETRRRELGSANAAAWLAFIDKKIPARSPLKILDAGTGAGFFSIILARAGHELTGIDLSTEMLREAEKNSRLFDCRAEFENMSADELSFADETFDVVISRNLTWTLPNVPKAYREWARVLKSGGVLLNFDADYGDKNFFDVSRNSHASVSNEQLDECGAIKDALEISSKRRPAWDAEFLRSIGMSVEVDEDISSPVYVDANFDFDRIALFAIKAIKP